jgi:hypothetical protein
MAIKRRRGTITTGAAGTGTLELSLGAAYAELLKVEFKGDSTDVDTNNTWAITDADGRAALVATAIDAGADDSTALQTDPTYSGAGRGIWLSAAEANVVDAGGDFSADTEGLVAPPICASPVTIALAAGTSGDVHEVTLFVRV